MEITWLCNKNGVKMKILQTDYSGSHMESIDKNFLFIIIEEGLIATRLLPDGRLQKTFTTDSDKPLGDFK